MKLNIYTDGGSRGNPGQAALGVYIENEKKEKLASLSRRLGITTNNIAEYSAILAGLNWVEERKEELKNMTQIDFYMDSQLAASQLNGLYKIKNAKLRQIYFEIKSKEQCLSFPATYTYIPREKNKKADALVNKALDEGQ